MIRLMLVPIGCLALAACNQGSVSLTNASTEEVAKAVKDAGGITFKAGEWETDVEVLEVEIPGMPAAMAEKMKNSPERFKKHKYCMTAEEAQQGGGGLFTGDEKSKCKVDKFVMNGGHIEQTVSCPDPSGKVGMTMSTSGTYTAESMKGTATMDMSAMGMKMKANISSKRVGDCPAKGAAK
ncbi:MAG: DUF3617 domain-containing protein [Pseudomonadota bacterium]